MKPTEIAVTNEDGEVKLVPLKEYIAGVIKEHEVKPFESEQFGTQAPDKIVKHIITNLSSDLEVSEEIAGSYAGLVEVIKNDIAVTLDSKKSSKEKAAEEINSRK
jgi:hypothetical protein